MTESSRNRSSLPKVFCKKDALRNFAKFTGKHLRHSLSFNKVAGLRPATLLKERLWHRCFPVKFAKFLRTPIFTEHSGGCFCDWTNNCTTLVTLSTAYILETTEVTKVSQNLKENTCVIVSFLIKLQVKRLWRRSFPVNFAKFLRAPFFKEHLWWLLLKKIQIIVFLWTS